MEGKEITALAREYAEEIYPNLSDKIISLRTQEIKNAERLIRFLLRRYCLVEKEKLRAIRWRKVYSADDVRSKFTEECLIDAIFPEIAKEEEK